MIREICFDTETTGKEIGDGNRILEIGCVELINKKITGKPFQSYLTPEGKRIEPGARNVIKKDDDFFKDKPLFSNVYQDFLDFIKNDILVAHNAPFDMGFINNEFKLIGLPPLENKVIDTLEIARKRRSTGNSLDNLCKEFKIDKTKREKEGHGALLDSQLLAEVYINLTKIQLNIFDEKKIDKDFTVDLTTNNEVNVEKRIFKISELDEKLHKEFIEKNIKNSLWYNNEI